MATQRLIFFWVILPCCPHKSPKRSRTVDILPFILPSARLPLVPGSSNVKILGLITCLSFWFSKYGHYTHRLQSVTVYWALLLRMGIGIDKPFENPGVWSGLPLGESHRSSRRNPSPFLTWIDKGRYPGTLVPRVPWYPGIWYPGSLFLPIGSWTQLIKERNFGILKKLSILGPEDWNSTNTAPLFYRWRTKVQRVVISPILCC